MSLKNLLSLQSAAKAKQAAPAESSEPAAIPTPTPAPAPAAKPKGGLMSLNQMQGKAPPPPAKPAPVESSEPAPFGLEDLASFDASTVNEVRESSGFTDEIEATAPERALSADLTKQQLEFIDSLDSIYQVLNDPEMFGQSVRIIMMELQENPEYIKLVADQDVHTMIRAMRNTMGLARIRKQEKSRKAGTGARKAAQKKSSVTDSDMAMLDALLGGGS